MECRGDSEVELVFGDQGVHEEADADELHQDEEHVHDHSCVTRFCCLLSLRCAIRWMNNAMMYM